MSGTIGGGTIGDGLIGRDDAEPPPPEGVIIYRQVFTDGTFSATVTLTEDEAHGFLIT